MGKTEWKPFFPIQIGFRSDLRASKINEEHASGLPHAVYMQLAVSSHFVNSHFVNSHFVNIDQMELTKWEVGQMGIDEVGIDKMRIDEVGINPTSYTPYLSPKFSKIIMHWVSLFITGSGA